MEVNPEVSANYEAAHFVVLLKCLTVNRFNFCVVGPNVMHVLKHRRGIVTASERKI
jgi:hypothetical protein